MIWTAAASAAVSIACVWASGRRFVGALSPSALDARMLTRALGTGRAANAAKLEAALARSPLRPSPWAWEGDDAWERAVLALMAEPSKDARAARLDEELMEFDGRVTRWSRVPRVCASIATSSGFLFGSIEVLRGLAIPSDTLADASPVLFGALDALSIGIAGMAFCAAVHVRARRAARDRFEAAARLVESLEEA